MAQYNVNNIMVSSLLSSIRDGTIAIPEIQRPFVWDPTKVRDLIDSLYKGYPVGYIIVWQNPDVKLKDGTISSGKKIIIDGQQRITALTAAIVGLEVVGADYKKKRIKIAFNPKEEKFETCNPAIEKDIQWIADISTVLQPGFDAFSFVNEYCDKNKITDNAEKSSINKVINTLSQIQNNSLGVIDLSSGLDIDSVTDIFIRINSKGKVLSQADFAMSKISSNERYKGDLIRKTIDYFCHLLQNPGDFDTIKNNDSDFANTDEFKAIAWIKDENEDIYEPDYTDLLRVAFTSKFHRGKLVDLVSLLSGRDFKTREFKEEIAEQSFKDLKESVLQFVNKTNFQRYLMIVKSTGIIDSSLVRSDNVMNFGYILYLALREKKIDAVIIERAVRRWLVLTILTGRYSASPESMFNYDITRFVDAADPIDYIEQTEAGVLSEAFWSNVLITRLNTAVASSPFYNVYLMAQVKSGDKGFLSEQIDVKSMIEQRGDIHHLFPKQYLINNGIRDKGMYNQIANYVYLQSEINIKVKDTAPNEYMATVLQQCEDKKPVYGGIVDKDELMQNLKANCVPEDFIKMDVKDFNRFLDMRRKLMAAKIKDYYESLK